MSKTIKERDKEIKKRYRDRKHRYEKLYEYLGELYEKENAIWYLRSIKRANAVNKAITGVLAVVMTALTFYINTAKEILGVSSRWFSVFASIILLCMVYNILSNIACKEYVIGIMVDIENDMKDHDIHGKSKYDKLIEQIKKE